jgi:hypothetical protein
MQNIELVADEGSSYFPTVEFLDELGDPFTPSTLYWKLTDLHGNIINGRDAVNVASPDDTLTLQLGAADLAVTGDEIAARIITCWGTYTSISYGAGKNFSLQAKFNIQPRVGG